MGNGSAWRILGIVVLTVYGVAIGGLCFAQEGGQAGKEAVKGEQQAQQKEEQAQPKKEEPAGKVVEEVTVTAQKRPEDIQKIPLAVSTLSGTDLSIIMTAGPDIRAISGRVPSLTLESSFGRAFPRFYMRGLGNTDFDLNASQPVSMVVDEVVMENPIVKGMPLFDLDRIEVLRGPQGTLFGRNTPAGVIKFDTKRPTQDFDANFRVSYGTYNNIDVNGGVGGALSKTLSARFSALYQGQGDWVDNKLHRRGQRPRGLQHHRLPPAVPVGAERQVQRPVQRPRLGRRRHRADLPRQHHQEGHQRPGRRLPAGRRLPGRPERAEDQLPGRLAAVRLRLRCRDPDLGHGLREPNDMYSRGDIDGGFGGEFDGQPCGPGLHPVPVGERRRDPLARPVDRGAADREQRRGGASTGWSVRTTSTRTWTSTRSATTA